jgi:IS5 family transposase
MLASSAFMNIHISQIDIQYTQFSGILEADMLMTDDFFRNRLDQMIDLQHPLAVLANRNTMARRPRLPKRLNISLLYLKHAFNESDEDVVQRWDETQSWQYFSGNEYFEHRWPCDSYIFIVFFK